MHFCSEEQHFAVLDHIDTAFRGPDRPVKRLGYKYANFGAIEVDTSEWSSRRARESIYEKDRSQDPLTLAARLAAWSSGNIFCGLHGLLIPCSWTLESFDVPQSRVPLLASGT
jgi:hypothetical protein